jgi:leader peptidase (prepilin peptidase)/N-methyltransferase
MSGRAVEAALTLYVFAVGACVGSFLNVVIARLPKGKSIVRPPSACPRCGNPIRWYDNIPVVSWILLRAKCRNCGLPISPRYPLVELLTAVLVVAVFRRFGLGWHTLGYAVFVCSLVALTFIDLDTWLLPHEITWPLIALGLASPLWNPELHFPDAAIGAAAGGGFFAAIALFGEKVLKRETMGWGDVYLLAGLGAWLGWQALLPVVLLSAVQGSIVGALLLWFKRPHAGAQTEPLPAAGPPEDHAASDDDWVPPPHAVPFGPFLALAALEQLLVGTLLEETWFGLMEHVWH